MEPKSLKQQFDEVKNLKSKILNSETYSDEEDLKDEAFNKMVLLAYPTENIGLEKSVGHALYVLNLMVGEDLPGNLVESLRAIIFGHYIDKETGGETMSELFCNDVNKEGTTIDTCKDNAQVMSDVLRYKAFDAGNRTDQDHLLLKKRYHEEFVAGNTKDAEIWYKYVREQLESTEETNRRIAVSYLAFYNLYLLRLNSKDKGNVMHIIHCSFTEKVCKLYTGMEMYPFSLPSATYVDKVAAVITPGLKGTKTIFPPLIKMACNEKKDRRRAAIVKCACLLSLSKTGLGPIGWISKVNEVYGDEFFNNKLMEDIYGDSTCNSIKIADEYAGKFASMESEWWKWSRILDEKNFSKLAVKNHLFFCMILAAATSTSKTEAKEILQLRQFSSCSDKARVQALKIGIAYQETFSSHAKGNMLKPDGIAGKILSELKKDDQNKDIFEEEEEDEFRDV